MYRTFIFSFPFDPLVSILQCIVSESRESEHDADKREYFVKSFAELCQMSNGLLKLLYKKSVKYDALVISASLGIFVLTVLAFVQAS